MKSIRFLARAAVIGGMYAALTLCLAPISFGAVNFRIAEAMSILAYFSPVAVAGLTAGCAIANMWSPFGLVDVVFGSLATLIAGIITYKIPKRGYWKFLAPLPSAVINALIIGAVITFVAPVGETTFKLFVANAISVGLPQLAVCYGLGLPILLWIESKNIRIL